jgi:hypothetical protein
MPPMPFSNELALTFDKVGTGLVMDTGVGSKVHSDMGKPQIGLSVKFAARTDARDDMKMLAANPASRMKTKSVRTRKNFGRCINLILAEES